MKLYKLVLLVWICGIFGCLQEETLFDAMESTLNTKYGISSQLKYKSANKLLLEVIISGDSQFFPNKLDLLSKHLSLKLVESELKFSFLEIDLKNSENNKTYPYYLDAKQIIELKDQSISKKSVIELEEYIIHNVGVNELDAMNEVLPYVISRTNKIRQEENKNYLSPTLDIIVILGLAQEYCSGILNDGTYLKIIKAMHFACEELNTNVELRFMTL